MKPLLLRHALIGILLVPLALTACSPRDPLAGTAWRLDAYRETRPIEGTTITLVFKDGEAGGSAGCNAYGGQYEVGRSGISFDQLFATEMYCLDPEGVMQQELEYLEHLAAAERFEVRDGQLLIYFSEHDALTFAPLD